jgi:uncharacterized zinc-type alcohol dehydrogenase-like protein
MPVFQGFATHAAGAELLPYKYDPGDIKPNEVEIAIFTWSTTTGA